MGDFKELIEKFKKFFSVTEEERKEALKDLQYPSAQEWQRQTEIWIKEAALHRTKFLKEYPLGQREVIYFCSTAAVFLFSGGIFRRVRSTVVYGLLGGIAIVPEHFRPYI